MATKRLYPISPPLTVAEGGTNIATATAAGGAVYAASTTAYGVTAAGTTGQVLTSVGASAPTWGPPPGQIMATPVTTATASTVTSGTTDTRDAVLGNYVFTALAGHRYEVKLSNAAAAATANDLYVVRVRNGGASTPTTSSTALVTTSVIGAGTGGATQYGFFLYGTFSPGAGTQTLGVFVQRTSGTGTMNIVGANAFTRELYVVDLGVSA